MNMSLSLVFFLVPLILIILINQITSSASRRRLVAPPGPRPWPIIGNALQMCTKRPHALLANLAKVHGPLLSLRIGTRVVIVASSATSAAEILKTHDVSLCARSILASTPYENHVLDRLSLVWNPTCNDQWKFLRKLCRTELFSAKAIELQASLRGKKLVEILHFLSSKQGHVVNIGEVVFTSVCNTISNLLFSKDLLSFEDEVTDGGLKNLFSTMMELAASPNIAECHPILKWLDPQGIKGKMSNYFDKLFSFWEIYIKERRERERYVVDAPKADFLDVLLSNGLDDYQINGVVLDLLIGGVGTTSTAVEWAMAELLKNRTVLDRVHEELNREINKSDVNESHILKLKYLNACVKESLRLHPPAPLLNHGALDSCKVMDYNIPKDSVVLVNVWAIGRDPSIWKNPLSFEPERFLNSNIDFMGNDFEFLPFGSGRRICPGLPMASRQLPLILAALIHCFDWSLQNGQDPATLDMNDKFELILAKDKPLLVVPKSKL